MKNKKCSSLGPFPSSKLTFFFIFLVQKYAKISYCVNEYQLFLFWKDLLDTTRLLKITKREVICK